MTILGLSWVREAAATPVLSLPSPQKAPGRHKNITSGFCQNLEVLFLGHLAASEGFLRLLTAFPAEGKPSNGKGAV